MSCIRYLSFILAMIVSTPFTLFASDKVWIETDSEVDRWLLIEAGWEYSFSDLNDRITREYFRDLCISENNGWACFTLAFKYGSRASMDIAKRCKYYEMAYDYGMRLAKDLKQACDCLKPSSNCQKSDISIIASEEMIENMNNKDPLIYSLPILYDVYSKEDENRFKEGIKTLERNCLYGSITNCQALIYQYEYGLKKGIYSDFRKGLLDVFREAESLGDPTIWYLYAMLYSMDTFGIKDPEKAKGYLEKGCKSGHPDSCNDYAGYFYKDRPEYAAILYERACEGGSVAGCVNLAHMYRKGKDVEQSEMKYRTLLKRACYLGDTDSCIEMAKNLRGDENDDQFLYYARACRNNIKSFACGVVAYLIEMGYYKPKNMPSEKTINSLYRRGCWDNHSYSCSRYLATNEDKQEALKELKSLCDEKGLNYACEQYGIALEKGLSGVKDIVEARRAYEKACVNPGDISCVRLAVMLYGGIGGKKEVERAVKLINESCPTGQEENCVDAGWFISGVYADEISMDISRKSCYAGQEIGCFNLGWQLLLRDDIKEAERAFEIGCLKGLSASCLELAYLLSKRYKRESERLIKENIKKAQDACEEIKDGEFCLALAGAYKLKREIKKVDELIKRGDRYLFDKCDRSDLASCRIRKVRITESNSPFLWLDRGAERLSFDIKGKNPFEKGDIWSGFYYCLQGRTDLDLKIEETSQNNITAIFDLHYIPQKGDEKDIKGRFYLKGRYDPYSGYATFTPGEWIERPEGWITAGMEGRVDGDTFYGIITLKGCGAFILKKVK